MIARFGFLSNPILVALNSADSLIPGVLSVCGIHQSESGDWEVCRSVKHKPNSLSRLSDESIIRLTSNTQMFWWFNPNDASSPKLQRQMVMNDEFENSCLAMKFVSPIEGFIIVELSSDKNSFGPVLGDSKLTTDSKAIIGQLLYRSFSTLILQAFHDSTVHKKVSHGVHLLEKSQERSCDEIGLLQTKLKDANRELARYILQQLADKECVDFKLTEDALQTIDNFNGSIEELRERLESAFVIAVNLMVGSSATINAAYLDFKPYQSVAESKKADVLTPELPYDRYEKTRNLLNRMEIAARTAKQKGLSLTGKNVGECLQPPITAAAISDAIKNHRSKIITLLNNHPNEWLIIRNEFRPVVNVLPPQNGYGRMLIGA